MDLPSSSVFLDVDAAEFGDSVMGSMAFGGTSMPWIQNKANEYDDELQVCCVGNFFVVSAVGNVDCVADACICRTSWI